MPKVLLKLFFFNLQMLVFFATIPLSDLSAIDHPNESYYNNKLLAEKALKEAVDTTLNKILGQGNFYTSVMALTQKNKSGNIHQPLDQRIESYYIDILVDKQSILNSSLYNALHDKFKETYLIHLELQLKNELAKVMKDHHVFFGERIVFIDFKPPNEPIKDLTYTFKLFEGYIIPLSSFIFILLGLSAALYFLIYPRKKKRKASFDPLESTRISLDKRPMENPSDKPMKIMDILNGARPESLAHYLQSESIRSLALILIHLTPERAAAMISAWPIEKQTQLIITLFEMYEENDEKILEQSFQVLERPFHSQNNSIFIYTAFSTCQCLQLANQKKLVNKMFEIEPKIATEIEQELEALKKL